MTRERQPVRYETFLFTRNQRRDFTAFVRPAALSNKDVSLLASAFNYVNDITPLTPERPGLYSFPLGAYQFILRHYNSGRTHAGREIPVIEGVAVRLDRDHESRAHVVDFVSRHSEMLDITGDADVEALEIRSSDEREWLPQIAADSETAAPEGEPPEIVQMFVERYRDERLVVPFSDEGRELLAAALAHDHLPALYFAFGTNRDVVARLGEAGIEFDVLGYFGTAEPELKRRNAPRVIDVREILPDEAAVPSNFAATMLSPEPPDALRELGDDTEALEPIREERDRRRQRRQRSLVRALVDWLLGRP